MLPVTAPHIRAMARATYALAAGVTVALAVSGCSPLRHLLRPDAVTTAPAVRTLEPVQSELQAADDASAYLLLSIIGRTATPDSELPIWRMVYRPFVPDLREVLIVAGVHGNETAGVECALQLVRSLSAAVPASAPYNLDLLPMLNPWGYVHDLPDSPVGVDIATDFSSFDSHEARLMRRFLRDKRYDLVVDLREDADAEGFSIWQYGLPDTRVARLVVDRVRAAGFPIADSPAFTFLRPKEGVVEAPMWGLTVLRLSRELTLAGYIRGGGVSALVFTVVTPAGRPLPDRAAMQRIAVDALLSEYAVLKPESGAKAGAP